MKLLPCTLYCFRGRRAYEGRRLDRNFSILRRTPKAPLPARYRCPLPPRRAAERAPPLHQSLLDVPAEVLRRRPSRGPPRDLNQDALVVYTPEIATVAARTAPILGCLSMSQHQHEPASA